MLISLPGQFPRPARLEDLPMSDLRCTCGAWEKLEEAWKRIEAVVGSGKGLVWNAHSFDGSAILKVLAVENRTVSCEAFCNIPVALFDLADLHDPPKPKEREWRVGDLVMRLGSIDPHFINYIHEDSLAFRHSGYREHTNTQDQRDYLNLTILARQSEEK